MTRPINKSILASVTGCLGTWTNKIQARKRCRLESVVKGRELFMEEMW